jgi:hypothetical protein
LTRLYIIPTVDTENPQTPTRKGYLQDNLNEVEVDGTAIGARKIAEVFHSCSVFGTFFLTPDEVGCFGEQPVRALARSLVELDQDVQLHTHPFWRDPLSRRVQMWQYSLQEQIEILKRGAADLQAWTGQPVIAHRAGGYSLNDDTIRALRETGIAIDSSMFYRHPNCKLAWSRNQIVEREGIIEIPVSVFLAHYDLRWHSIKQRLVSQFISFNLNYSQDELLGFIEQALELNLRVVTFFMHSYSLIKRDFRYKHYQLDAEKTRRLESFLKQMKANPSVQIINTREFLARWQQSPQYLIGADGVPQGSREVSVQAAARVAVKMVGRRLGCLL